MTHTLESLRKAGYRVDVIHNREVVYNSLNDVEFAPCGGQTVVTIEAPNKTHGAKGIANCSKVDNYNRKMGYKIALGRALKQMPEFKDIV